MSRWYWGAVACAALLVLTYFMPGYVTKEGGAVWPWQIGRGWNNRDADGNPTHDDVGNRIYPNRVRTAALIGFGLGALALTGAGYFYPKKRRRRPEEAGQTPQPKT